MLLLFAALLTIFLLITIQLKVYRNDWKKNGFRSEVPILGGELTEKSSPSRMPEEWGEKENIRQ